MGGVVREREGTLHMLRDTMIFQIFLPGSGFATMVLVSSADEFQVRHELGLPTDRGGKLLAFFWS